MRADKPYGHLYGSARWKKLRLRQLQAEPLCRYCKRKDQVREATVCDHIDPHKGDEVKFWSGPFQSLCRDCHNTTKAQEEGRARVKVAIGLDGWPEQG